PAPCQAPRPAPPHASPRPSNPSPAARISRPLPCPTRRPEGQRVGQAVTPGPVGGWARGSRVVRAELQRDPLPDEDQVGVRDGAAVGGPDRPPATVHVVRRRDLAQRVAGLDDVGAGAGRAGAHGGVAAVGVVLLRVVLLVRRTTLRLVRGATLRAGRRLRPLRRARAALAVAVGVARGRAGALAAHRPGADALALQDLLRDGDLLRPGRLVGRGGVLAAAVGVPGALGELQAAVETVAGVD